MLWGCLPPTISLKRRRWSPSSRSGVKHNSTSFQLLPQKILNSVAAASSLAVAPPYRRPAADASSSSLAADASAAAPLSALSQALLFPSPPAVVTASKSMRRQAHPQQQLRSFSARCVHLHVACSTTSIGLLSSCSPRTDISEPSASMPAEAHSIGRAPKVIISSCLHLLPPRARLMQSPPP